MIRLALAAALLVQGTAALAREAAGCTPIRFARGAFSATVSGTAGWDEPEPLCYSLATGAGQTASLRVTRSNGNTAFTIEGVTDPKDRFSFRTEAKTYRIRVFQLLRDTPRRFSLLVTVR